ncbi:hypothetical protein G7Y89_g15519 [Cudoniella acicularis]|uniref:Uncharacterized protein n=1 Tax=Cudoniella acicularis TaxID=354080 RepID=A0A8H4QLJ6_9HELO|nr:hypothetical protein G7Y89_g15519 [Cudoniella acicularis]
MDSDMDGGIVHILLFDSPRAYSPTESHGEVQVQGETSLAAEYCSSISQPPKVSIGLSVTERKMAFWQQGGSAFSTDTLVGPDSQSKPGAPFGDSGTGTMTTYGGTPLENIEEVSSHDSPRSQSGSNGEAKWNEKGKGKGPEVDVVTVTLPPLDVVAAKAPLEPKKCIEYLAGLTILLSIIVSIDHFGSTFVPALIFPGAPYHHERDLAWISEKAVTRNFRIMIPIVAVIMLEYFLIQCGALKWLEYLPSITWSTWPYVTSFDSFGSFVSECFELAYLVPNAVPQIIFNYCTGVLWTMPVQLQGSWLVLLGVVVIREIKNPWKRFSYYALCTILHCVDVVNQVADWSFINYQYRIHSDILTALPIYQADPDALAPYYIPRLNGLTFAISLQALIELSPAVQAVLSMKILTWIFPHNFTIYLFHGLVF